MVSGWILFALALKRFLQFPPSSFRVVERSGNKPIDATIQAKGFQTSGIFCGQPSNHASFHLDQAKTPLLFDDLGIGKVCQESQDGFAIWFRCEPLAEVGGECIGCVRVHWNDGLLAGVFLATSQSIKAR